MEIEENLHLQEEVPEPSRSDQLKAALDGGIPDTVSTILTELSKRIVDPFDRSDRLSRLGDNEGAIEAARAIEDPFDRSARLSTLGDTEGAIEAARAIEDPYERIRELLKLRINILDITTNWGDLSPDRKKDILELLLGKFS